MGLKLSEPLLNIVRIDWAPGSSYFKTKNTKQSENYWDREITRKKYLLFVAVLNNMIIIRKAECVVYIIRTPEENNEIEKKAKTKEREKRGSSKPKLVIVAVTTW